MDNLHDYVGWYGPYGFDAIPFNEIDAMVLCAVAYYDLGPVFSDGDDVHRLRDCLPWLNRGQCRYTVGYRELNYADVLYDIAASERFGTLLMTDYVDVARADPPLQFAAVTFRRNDAAFIAFRGTDSTIAGWREDFMISFMLTEAQLMAKDYAAHQVSSASSCRIGGHSKGGNLALYAACSLDDALWDRVARVYLLDGPGLCPEVTDTGRIRRIDPKTTSILPAFSIVGRLFEPALSDVRIVKSSGFSVLQHSLGGWGVDHGRLAIVPGPDPASRRINAALQRWIDDIPQDKRATFVDELFDALSSTGAVTLADIVKGGPSGILGVLRGVMNTSADTRRTAAELPMRAVLGGSYDEIAEGLTAIFNRGDGKRAD